MAVSSSDRQTLLSRGYTDADIESFLTNNPGDEGRILSALSANQSPTGGGSSSSTPSGGTGGTGSTGGTGGTGGTGSTGSTTSTTPAMTALSAMGGGGGMVAPTDPSQADASAQINNMLRPSLGTRTFPIQSSALAELRRIY